MEQLVLKFGFLLNKEKFKYLKTIMLSPKRVKYRCSVDVCEVKLVVTTV